jgi:tetratricopeptide (TPR) repeat protein
LYYRAVPGIEPVLVEHHDGALHVWRRLGIRAHRVVHVDAHHDMWRIDDRLGAVTIANYLCQAVRDGIVRDVVWVVPDGAWANADSRRTLRRLVRALAGEYGRRAAINEEDRRLTTTIGNTPLVVCALDTLPPCPDPVLLDIDTDFMILPRVEHAKFDVACRFPWILPEQLASALGGLRAASVTIAYSVEGGYTPLEWKHLGDALALHWTTRDGSTHDHVAGYSRVNDAAAAIDNGDVPAALAASREAIRLLPESAAPFYQLARAHAHGGDTTAARAAYAEAVGRDHSYRSAYGSRGLVFLAQRRLEDATLAFNQMLGLDPGHAHAHWGLGRVAMARSQWPEAHSRLERAVALDSSHVEAWRDLGMVLSRHGRNTEAAAAYARSLKLALTGVVPVHEMSWTITRGVEPRDRSHGRTHAALAGLDAAAGRAREAEAGYRMAIAAGYDRAGLRLSMARLLARRGRWRLAAAELVRAAGQTPSALRRLFQRR